MKKNKKLNNLKKMIIILIVILLVIIGALLVILPKVKQKESEEITEEKIQQQIQQAQEEFLLPKSEKERMQIYLTRYLNFIEDKEYEKAYNLLYEEFRKSYFPSIGVFKKYIEETYFISMQVEYENFQRQGEYFILTVKLVDMLEPLRTKVQKFIIYEKKVNDFVLSFQAE